MIRGKWWRGWTRNSRCADELHMMVRVENERVAVTADVLVIQQPRRMAFRPYDGIIDGPTSGVIECGRRSARGTGLRFFLRVRGSIGDQSAQSKQMIRRQSRVA